MKKYLPIKVIIKILHRTNAKQEKISWQIAIISSGLFFQDITMVET